MSTDYAIQVRNLTVSYGPKPALLDVSCVINKGEIKRMGHASVEDLHERVKDVYSSVSLATIYKNIHLLVDQDILTEVPVHGRKPMYEINIGDHVHITCPACGAVEDVMDFDTAPIIEEAKAQTGRKFERVAVMLQGRCTKCSN